MDIFIEYAIIDNMVINYVLLFSTAKTVHSRTPKWQFFLSSALGTVGAMVLPFVQIHLAVVFILKIALGIAMVLLISTKDNFLKISIKFCIFLAYTFLLGGACIGFLSLTQADLSSFATLNYSATFPIGIMVLTIFLFVRFVHHGVLYINERRIIAPFLCEIEIGINGKSHKLSAFVDSGNRLSDPETDLPVTIVSWNWLKHYVETDEQKKIRGQDTKNLSLKNAHLIEVGTVMEAKSKILVFAPDFMFINGEKKEMMLGVTFEKFNDLVSYDALLHPAALQKRET